MEDIWFDRYMELQKTVDELLNNNARLRAALLLVKEHKLPYRNFSLNRGSNGVRDHFINIASIALE